jgi:predicted ATPase/DNA-binding CsgD family transcriptional regulator
MHTLGVPDRPIVLAAEVSARESEVLDALAEHMTNAEIGRRLFISVRTVESHVSSLLRKLQVDDRRALAAAADLRRHRPGTDDAADAAGEMTASSLPTPLTSFVGRQSERDALLDALDRHRLVSAVGPGGVGKTRLALQVAADARDRFEGGAWFADLVPVVDPGMVAAKIASTFRLGEHQGRTTEDTIVGWLGSRETLLVLDNCEHVLDGVIVLLERLLDGCPGLTVLATSRARLMVPFEWVFPVPGLSVDDDADDGGSSDAVELFVGRAEAGGATVPPQSRARVATVCRELDGMALAIELAAARYSSVGLDGLEAGLGDTLRMLTGGSRIHDRHRSLRATLDWSHSLLSDAEQAMLRRVSVFAAPFTADAAAAVLAPWSPVTLAAVPAVLASLAEQSLLIPSSTVTGTRYRALETIRQYGTDRLDQAGESDEGDNRHLSWCVQVAAGLAAATEPQSPDWRSGFDRIADELRSALRWAVGQEDHHFEAHVLANHLAALAFARGLPGESQRCYEQAAAVADGELSRAADLSNAAGAAEARHFGSESLRLRQAAAGAAVLAGDRISAARELARSAELINRGPGILASQPPPGEVDALLAEASALGDSDPGAKARILTARAFAIPETDPRSGELVEEAIVLSRRVHDSLSESAALDMMTSIQLARGEIRSAVASTVRRTELLVCTPMTAQSALEFFDAFHMAAECAVAAGDLPEARRFAEHARDLPFFGEQGHLATARLILVTTLAGDLDEAVVLAGRFRKGWERAGRPRAGNLGPSAYAAATAHGLRGDDEQRAEWLEIVRELITPGRPLSEIHFGEVFDALLLLHRGEPDQAVSTLATPPEELHWHYNGLWRPWYAALWAESAVLAAHPDAATRIERARPMISDNPIASAIVDRAEALVTNRRPLTELADTLDTVGCRYQWARTLVYIGGAERVRGETAMAAMGATPMVWTGT